MDRKSFIKNSVLGAIGLTAGAKALNAKPASTYNRLMEQVGFNHMPNIEERTMNSVLHKASSRGSADHGWLKVNHSFSFAQYYNPERMNFGVLRVLNDDTVAGGGGFPTHPHDNMEIITIPLSGDLEHKDNMGNSSIIKEGDIQVMSAGKGVYHSEFNPNKDKPVNLFQIWLFPNKKDVEPRYEQMKLKTDKMHNNFQQILSPNADDEGVWIHQDAWFHMGHFDAGKSATYEIRKPGNGVYSIIIEGEVTANGQQLGKRDALGVWDTDQVTYEFSSDAKLLLLEVPMSL